MDGVGREFAFMGHDLVDAIPGQNVDESPIDPKKVDGRAELCAGSDVPAFEAHGAVRSSVDPDSDGSTSRGAGGPRTGLMWWGTSECVS